MKTPKPPKAAIAKKRTTKPATRTKKKVSELNQFDPGSIGAPFRIPPRRWYRITEDSITIIR